MIPATGDTPATGTVPSPVVSLVEAGVAVLRAPSKGVPPAPAPPSTARRPTARATQVARRWEDAIAAPDLPRSLRLGTGVDRRRLGGAWRPEQHQLVNRQLGEPQDDERGDVRRADH